MSAGGRTIVEFHAMGATVSLFAFGEPATVTCRGFRYPLSEATLSPLSSLGVSNVVTADEATVEVIEGTLLVLTADPDRWSAKTRRGEAMSAG
jgi:thiamine pyrophosphokinase